MVAIFIENLGVWKNGLTLWSFIDVIQGVDGPLVPHCPHLGARMVGLDTHIVLFNTRFCLFLDVVFMPFYKFLPDLISVC